MSFYIVVGGKYMRLLLAEKLMEGERQFVAERVRIRLLGDILALLRSLKKGMVAAAQLCL